MGSLAVGKSDLYNRTSEYSTSLNSVIPYKKPESDSQVETFDNLYGQISRIFSVIDPILKEFDPISAPLYIVTDSHHLYCSFKDLINSRDKREFSKELINTALAVAYLVWNIIGSELWDKVGTVEDILENLSAMIQAFSHEEYSQMLERIFDIVNDLVWLLSYYYLYVEVEALSYAIDMVSNLYYGLKELKEEDRKLEFAGKMVITAIRAYNVFSFIPDLREKYEKRLLLSQLNLMTNSLTI